MTHADVRDRLADALLAPGNGGLDAALADQRAAGAALREHLAGCDACRAELEALRATGVLLAAAAPDTLKASSRARARTLAAAAPGVVRPDAVPSATSRSWPRTTGLSARAAVAAVLVLAVSIGGILGVVALSGQRDDARLEVARLRSLTAASQTLLGDQGAVRLALAGTAGQGTVALSPASGQLVVIAIGLPALPQGQRYDCFVERDGTRTWIGWMDASDGVAWWAGELSWAAGLGQPGDRFLVLAGSDGQPVLSGRF